jgi:hypothetical protein
MPSIVWLLLLLALTLSPASTEAARVSGYASKVASLIAPGKLATLGERGANSRVQKCVYWLEQARLAGENPASIAHHAVETAGYSGAAGLLTEQSLLRNLDIASKLGCLNKQGLSRMRRGGAPLVTRGPYAGDVASVDHIIPRAVAPELDCVVANLELLPLRMNESKNAKVGARQQDLAKRLRAAGLLSDAGLNAVLAHAAPR